MKEIQEEMKESESNLNYVQSHHGSLSEEGGKLEAKIRSMQNPIKEIIKLEFQLKNKGK